MSSSSPAVEEAPEQLRRNPVAKALALIEWLATEPAGSKGVREAAAALGWTPSTLHRILVLLENERWLSSEFGRYSLGPRFLNLALTVTQDFPLVHVAMPHLEALVRETDETCLLGLYDPTRAELTFIAAVESQQALRVAPDFRGDYGPLHAGSAGQAILAFLPEAEQELVIGRELPRITDRTITDPDSLRRRLAETRVKGYVHTSGERTVGCTGIAAPVIGPGGRVLGDINLTMPTSRFDPKRGHELARAVVRSAHSISNELAGARTPSEGRRAGQTDVSELSAHR